MSFYTDVIAQDPRFNSTTRINDPALLEPVTRAAIEAIVAEARSIYGISLMIFETYRSQARQTEMFNQGVSKLKVVGVHHFGLACDLVKDVSGEPSWKGDFSFLGKLARAHRLVWGGDWGHPQTPSGFVDPDHVQRCAVSQEHALFTQAWYPDAEYNPYAQLIAV